MLEILLGQIPEALYFSLFMIFTKQLKRGRLVFTLLMIMEYIIIQKLIHFDMWLQTIYTIFVYVILKVIYKEKAQITDIFTFTISSVLLIIIDVIVYFGSRLITNNYMIALLIDRIVLFVVLFLLKDKLPKIQSMYKRLWNRNDKVKKPIKSVTFRCINLVIFNLIFYIINVGMIYCIYINSL